MTKLDSVLKRVVDLFFALVGLLLFGWLILVCYVIAYFDTQESGFFRQIRIGMNGKPFKVIKLRSMRSISSVSTNITTDNDPRITKSGRVFRKVKLDELPQLINVVIGDMSLVGPRPDVPGYADRLSGDDRIVLSVRPGITGPASIYYKNEEEILANKVDPTSYNDNVIWPHKVSINKRYVREYTLLKDFYYIYKTIV